MCFDPPDKDEQFMQLLRNIGQERALRMLEKLRERREEVEKERSLSY